MQVAFTLHNLTYQKNTYSYRVYIGTEPNAQVITKSVTLEDGDSMNISTTLIPDDSGDRAKVTVELIDQIDQQQTIHFWVTRT